MKTYLDCIPCFVRQALEAARLATSDPLVHERVLRGVLSAAAQMRFDDPPPVMGQYIHSLVRKLSDNPDPYAAVKQSQNAMALELLPRMEAMVNQATDPLEMAVRLAIAGNVIDFGVRADIGAEEVAQMAESARTRPLIGDISRLREAAANARKILYIGDNAGEIGFDRLLVAQLPMEKLTFAVRGRPIINDATLDDARAVGLTEMVKVIDNGSDAPGTLWEDCAGTFRLYFSNADLIIAKGQGNYETLSGVEKPIYFLLQAKCPVIAGHIGCEQGSFVAAPNRSESRQAPAE